MVSSEFGRTPKINKDAGRDHWPKVFSVVLAGGGIKKGYIYGASNATASEPERDPIGPEDLATTVYHLLGIVADKELMAPGNRPDRDRRRRQGRQGTAGLRVDVARAESDGSATPARSGPRDPICTSEVAMAMVSLEPGELKRLIRQRRASAAIARTRSGTGST